MFGETAIVSGGHLRGNWSGAGRPVLSTHVRITANPPLEVSERLKNSFVQYLLSENVESYPAEPYRKQKALILLTMPLLTACKGSLMHIEEKYAKPGLHVSFSKREEHPQVSTVFKRDESKVLREGKNYYAVDIVFPFLESPTFQIVGTEKRCELTRTIVQSSDIVNKDWLITRMKAG